MSKNKISIFPNPCNGLFLINSDIKITNIEIFNSLGDKVYTSQENSEKYKLILSNQAKGLYFYNLKEDSWYFTDRKNCYRMIK